VHAHGTARSAEVLCCPSQSDADRKTESTHRSTADGRPRSPGSTARHYGGRRGHGSDPDPPVAPGSHTVISRRRHGRVGDAVIVGAVSPDRTRDVIAGRRRPQSSSVAAGHCVASLSSARVVAASRTEVVPGAISRQHRRRSGRTRRESLPVSGPHARSQDQRAGCDASSHSP